MTETDRNPIRKEARRFLDAYNEAFAGAFDRELGRLGTEDETRDPEVLEAIRHSVMNTMSAWFSKPADALDGEMPDALLDRIRTLDDWMEFFALAAARLDGDFPDPLKIRLAAFGPRSMDRLLTLALAPSWEEEPGQDDREDEPLVAAATALRLLGEWRMGAALDLVLDRFLEQETPDDRMTDALRAYLKDLGHPARDRLLDRLEDWMSAGRDMTPAAEYLLILLTELCAQARSERAYQCLKTAFRRMEHKVIGAICLGDYGDGRAIPALKGYLERAGDQVPRDVFYETVSAIRRLGGDVSDIRNPFRNRGDQVLH